MLKEVGDPVMDVSAYSIVFQLVQKLVMWNGVKRLAEIEDGDIYLELLVIW